MSSPAMNRRSFLGLSSLAIGGAAFGLAGCAPAAGPTGSGSPSAGGATSKGTVSNWLAFDNVEQGEWYRKHFVDDFNATADFTVDLVVKEQSTIDQNLQVAMTAGKAPDMIRSGGAPHVMGYTKAGYLRSLEDYRKQFDWDSKFQTWALQSMRGADGQIYGLPTSYNSVVMFHNPQTFDKYGWTLPKNLSEFEALMQDAQDHKLVPLSAGIGERDKATGWYTSGLLNAMVGPVVMYQGLTKQLSWTDPVFVDAIAKIQDYCLRGWLGGGPEKYATTKFADMYTRLAQGEAAMQIMLSWAFSTMPPFFGPEAGNDATYEFSPVPPLGDGVPQDLYIKAIGSAISINSASPAPELAAEYLDWTFDPKRQLEGLAEVALPLHPVALGGTPMPAKVDEQLGKFYTALDAATNVGYGSWCSFPPDCATLMYVEMEKVVLGAMSPKDFCALFDETFKKSYEAGLVPSPAEPAGA